MLLLEKIRASGSLGVIHFVGIGGIGMSGIAEIMHNLGYEVQGSDIAENYNTLRLAESGIKIFYGQKAANVTDCTYVVLSSAIKQDNPEVQSAILNKIPIITRAQMLAELMRLKCSIAVSGSHGKTTTTSLIACIFEAAGFCPTVINGGIINSKSTNAYIGSGDYLIAEADESDATFIQLPATIAVITNIDKEHMDFYTDFEHLIDAFRSFIKNLPFYGFAVACIDHGTVRHLIQDIVDRRIITYGIESVDANIRALNIKSAITSSTFDVIINLPQLKGVISITEIMIPTPGMHNVLNALAAIAVAIELDFGIKAIKNGFKNFKGVKRRFTKIMEYNGASIIDDYAHHPAEIIETLKTAKSVASKQNGKVIAIFQPHRYSRLQNLFEEFSACFAYADKLYITDVYAAGEQAIDNISGKSLVERIKYGKLHSDINFIETKDMIPNIIKTYAAPGDIVIMMGAGSISSWANAMPQALRILDVASDLG